MKQNKLPKADTPKILSTTIDADVLARINEKIAKAHEQNKKVICTEITKRGIHFQPSDILFLIDKRKR